MYDTIDKEFETKANNLVYATIVNIYSLSKSDKQIVLHNLDREDKNHLFVIHAAMAARDVMGIPLYANGSWSLKHWLKKNYPTVKWTTRLPGNVDVPELLNFERPYLDSELAGYNYSDVYELFYERTDDNA